MIKTTKKSLRALMMCALLLVGGFIVVKAMSNTEKVKKAEETTVITTTWYFTGGEHDDPTDPSNYTENPNQAPPCGLPLQTICQIEAPDDGHGKPNMDAPVEGEHEDITVSVQIEEAFKSLTTSSPITNTIVKDFRAH